MKYHPDRNPGREVEYIAKFQAIQAAHEILTDPQQRLKYDTDRLRAGYGKLYGPPKSDFPPRSSNSAKFSGPPPRRAPTAAQPPRPQANSSYQTPPSTGAQRYASYAKAGGAKWEQPYDEAQTRADAFRGFQNMKGNSGNHNRGGTHSWSKFDPRTGQSSAYQATAESWARSGTAPGGQKPRQQQNTYDPFSGKAGSNQQFPRSQSTKKKQGFAPGDPGGDEPMAKNTSAYVNKPRERSQSTYFEPAPSPTAKKSPLRSQQSTAEDEPPKTPFMSSYAERSSNRYANAGGEKTYFGRGGLDRSASVRNPTYNQANSHANPPSPLSPTSSRGRHHSASPKLRPDHSRPFSSSDSSDTDDSPAARPKAVPRSRLRPDKLKRGFFAQYNKNQDSGETIPNTMRPENASDGAGIDTNSSQIPNPFQESKAQDVNDIPSNVNADFDAKTKDDGEWDRSKTGQDHNNDTWRFRRRGSLKKPDTNFNPGPHGHPNLNSNVNSNPNLRAAGASGTPGSMNNSTMYDPFHKDCTKSYSRTWSEQWGFSTPPTAAAPRKPPLWAYPSSVLPQHMLRKKEAKGEKPTAATDSSNPSFKNPFLHSLSPDSVPSQSSLHSLNQTFETVNADPGTRDNSFNNHATAYMNPNHQPQDAGWQSPMKSKSHESMNMSFSANDWNGKFEGSSEFFAPKPSSGDEHQRFSRKNKRASPTRGKANERPRSASQSNSGGANYATAQFQPQWRQQESVPFAEATFPADKWAQDLKDNTWTFPNNEPRTTTDRHPSPKKPQKATKQRTNIPKPASVAVEGDGEEETYATSEENSHPKKGYGETGDGVGGGGEAMDIDDDAPAARGPAAMNNGPSATTQQGEPRLVSVEPNNPNWRASAKQGQQQPQQQPHAGAHSASNPLNAAKSANNLFNLSKLNNVAPFTPTNSTGINDLNDLNTSLPFDSKSGNTVNNNTSSRLTVRPGDLALPKPPKAPVPPRFASDHNPLDPTQQQRPILTQQTWERYVAEMGAYMSEWNAFNRKMLAHFNARQETVETGLHPRWIGAVGDSSRLNVDAGLGLDADAGKGPDGAESLVAGSGKGGYNAYLRGIDEDVVVRKHWDVAWERHRACIVALGEVKDRIRAGGRLGR